MRTLGEHATAAQRLAAYEGRCSSPDCPPGMLTHTRPRTRLGWRAPDGMPHPWRVVNSAALGCRVGVAAARNRALDVVLLAAGFDRGLHCLICVPVVARHTRCFANATQEQIRRPRYWSQQSGAGRRASRTGFRAGGSSGPRKADWNRVLLIVGTWTLNEDWSGTNGTTISSCLLGAAAS